MVRHRHRTGVAVVIYSFNQQPQKAGFSFVLSMSQSGSKSESDWATVSSVMRSDCKIVVGDKGDQPANVRDSRLTYLRLPLDIGLSATRDRIVDDRSVMKVEDFSRYVLEPI